MTTSVIGHAAPLAGTRELVGGEAEERRALVSALLGRLSKAHYALVRTPIFDAEDVFLRGPGLVPASDYLRFVEGESGKTAVLRPDITPQIARLAATRFDAKAFPLRFAYAGIVFRRTTGRAQKKREIEQIGAELIGDKTFSACEEVLRLSVDGCRTAGLATPTVALSHAALGHLIVERFPAARKEALATAMARRDLVAFEALLRGEKSGAKLLRDVARLLELRGTAEDANAVSAVLGRRARPALDEMLAAHAMLRTMRGVSVTFDFDEVRGLAYYTGLRFGIFARGAGEAIGGGGRYDGLLSAHGLRAPAVGFALDAELLAASVAAQGRESFGGTR